MTDVAPCIEFIGRALVEPNKNAAPILTPFLASTAEIDISRAAYGAVYIPTAWPLTTLTYYVAPYTADYASRANCPAPVYQPLYDLSQPTPNQGVYTLPALPCAVPLFALGMGAGGLKLVTGFANASGGLGWTAAAATTAALPAGTYSNGTAGSGATFTITAEVAVTIDGAATVLDGIYLIKNQASGLQNGLYQCTTLGVAASAQAVFTRVAGADVTGDYVGQYVQITAGTVNGSTLWECTNAAAPTVGTTAITYAQVSGNGFVCPVSLKS